MGVAAIVPLTSCTSTSNLSSVSNQNVRSVATIAPEPTTTSGDQVGGVSEEAAGSQSSPQNMIVGLPAEALRAPQIDPVAVEKPASTTPPVLLASVPRTPVGNRPTNQIMMVRTTAYSHMESDHLKYGRKSAAGTTLKYGSQERSAAADWSKYPLGTRFMIEGLPYQYVVDDYGSALVGTETIDIYKPEISTMGKWGVRNVPIRVLEWGSFEESRKILDSRKHVRHADHVRKMLNEIEKKGRSGYLTPGSGGSA